MQPKGGTLDPAIEEDDGASRKRTREEGTELAAKAKREGEVQGAKEERPDEPEEEARTVRAPPIPVTPSN